MLKKFSVSNFKCFKDKITLDLGAVNGYNFNSEAIKNGIVKSGIIYGHNGSGKSNIALGIFDITKHLTDLSRLDFRYSPYLNADSSQDHAEFEYTFLFNGTEVVYRYAKSSYDTLVAEELIIDSHPVVTFDRRNSQEFISHLDGTKNLNKTISQPQLSALKYIRNNSELPDDKINRAFKELFSFVEGMLFFKSLDERVYVGRQPKSTNLFDTIISNGLLTEYNDFLRQAGIECDLEIAEKNDGKTIVRVFQSGKRIEIDEIWSTGTSNLTLFFCWYQQVINNEVSFLFIDEFDAFYHFDISRSIINLLKNSSVQTLLTTHNTANMTNSLLRPDCYFLIHPDRISQLSRLTHKELREAHNIEKMYKAGSFNG